MEKINLMFDNSETPLAVLNGLCPFGTLDRNALFDQIKTGICSESMDKDTKDVVFDTARDYINKTLLLIKADDGDVIAADKAAIELYALLDDGQALDCGGP